MIVLKDTGSEFFDEAYFMLKSGKLPKKVGGEKDFIAEANKIVLNASGEKNPPEKIPKKKYFFTGFFSGALFAVAVFVVSAVI